MDTILVATPGTFQAKNRWVTFVAFLLLPLAALAQTTVEQNAESGLAHARLVAARTVAKSITAPQCLADLSSWETKDEADDKAKVEQPNLWYQKLSTEELVRLDAESIHCTGVLRHTHHKEDSAMMPYFGRSFALELIDRAEAVLAEHHLMQEYLLKSSE